MDKRYLSLQERTRRGALPLKKRRLVDVGNGPQPLLSFGPLASSASAAAGHRMAKLPELPFGVSATATLSRDGQEQHGDKIAALALVAAAAAASGGEKPAPRRPAATHRVSLDNNVHHYSNESRSSRSTEEKEAHAPSIATLTGRAAGAGRAKTSSSKKAAKTGSTSSLRIRIAGRRASSTSSPTPSSATSTVSAASSSSSGGTATTTSTNHNHQHGSRHHNHNSHQDKRYTGSADEIRCGATTTRGRACAFIAVNGTPYCNLHSDYAKNPPPRRGGGSGCGSGVQPTSPKSVSTSTTDEEDLPSPSLPSAQPPKKMPAAAVGSSSKRSSGGGSRRSTLAKRAEKHAGSPYPLLSMISTDQWVGKMVTVATGPMAQRVGEVEKIGNGWVSVRIPGVGLHNRRSFELYIQGEEDDENVTNNSTNSKKKAHRKGRKGDLKEDDQDSSLRRCVSREAVSPSPLSSSASDNGSAASGLKEAPRPPSTIVGCSTFESSSDGAASDHANVLGTPRPTPKEFLKATTVTPGEASRHIVLPSIASPIPSNGYRQKHHDERRGAEDSASRVSPVSPKKAYAELPLVQSLLLAQEGGAKKYNMDMLFGTAALERSRRNISRPTRYEDNEMISPPPNPASKKRSRRESMEGYDHQSTSNDGERSCSS